MHHLDYETLVKEAEQIDCYQFNQRHNPLNEKPLEPFKDQNYPYNLSKQKLIKLRERNCY